MSSPKHKKEWKMFHPSWFGKPTTRVVGGTTLRTRKIRTARSVLALSATAIAVVGIYTLAANPASAVPAPNTQVCNTSSQGTQLCVTPTSDNNTGKLSVLVEATNVGTQFVESVLKAGTFDNTANPDVQQVTNGSYTKSYDPFDPGATSGTGTVTLQKAVPSSGFESVSVDFAWQFSAPPSSSPPPPPDGKVTICHRTASTNNPYVEEPVSFDATTGKLRDNGHGDHTTHTGPVFPATGPDGKWGDIIPSFTWPGDATHAGGTYDGLNWPDGKAILDNGCKPVQETSSPPSTSSAPASSSTPPPSGTSTSRSPSIGPPLSTSTANTSHGVAGGHASRSVFTPGPGATGDSSPTSTILGSVGLASVLGGLAGLIAWRRRRGAHAA